MRLPYQMLCAALLALVAQPAESRVPNHANVLLADGVKTKFGSSSYPGKYPRCVWNTWKVSTSDADGALQLSCDVIKLDSDDLLVVSSGAGDRQTFQSHVKSIETTAVSPITVEFRSDSEDRSRIHCSVRTVASAEVESAPRSGTPVEEDSDASLSKVDINHSSCGKNRFYQKIVRGKEPPPHFFPWLVALIDTEDKPNKPFCAGSIISERHIVTAAHCVEGRNAAQLPIAVAKHKRQGDTEEEIFDVKRITIHEEYNKMTYDADIAIIELKESLRSRIADEKAWVRPICLPEETCQTQNNCYVNRISHIAGWGEKNHTDYREQETETLLHATVPIIDNSECKNHTDVKITSRMICAGLGGDGADSCLGDSGGPLAVPNNSDVYTLAGVTSFGRGCGENAGVYTRVSELTDWIREHSRL